MPDKYKIQKNLKDLSFKSQIVFAASCCERLLPFYFAFSKIEHQGNPTLLRNTLNEIWKIAKTEQFSSKELESSIQFCEASIPDSEDFTSSYTGLAQIACIAIYNSLNFCVSRDTELLDSVRRATFEAIESYLCIVNDPILEVHIADSQFDKWIETAPILLAEIKYQQEDLELLSKTQPDNLLIEKIRYKSTKSGVHPERRGLL